MIFERGPRALDARTKNYVVAIASGILFFYGISLGMNNYINMYLNEMGVTKIILRSIIQTGIIGALLVAPIMMKLSETFGIYKIIFVSFILRSAALICITTFTEIRIIMLLVFLIGLTEFCIFVSLWFWVSSILPKKKMRLAIAGFYCALMGGVALSLTYLYQNNNYTMKSPFIYSVVCNLMILGLCFIAREHIPKLHNKVSNSKPSKVVSFIMIPALSVLVSNYLYQSLSRFAPTYAMSFAQGYSSSMKIFYYFLLGNLLITPIIAFAMNKFGTRLSYLISSILVLSMLSIAMHFTVGMGVLSYIIFILMGGLIGIIFVMAVEEIGTRLSAKGLLVGIIVISLMDKLGGYSGIFITGAALEYWGSVGFVIAIGVVTLFFLLYIIYHLNNEKR